MKKIKSKKKPNQVLVSRRLAWIYTAYFKSYGNVKGRASTIPIGKQGFLNVVGPGFIPATSIL